MKLALKKIHRVAAAATAPIQFVVAKIPHPRKQKTVKVCVGVTIMLVGSTMATHPVLLVPHIVWDALAYGLHGYGALPIIKILCARFDLEHLEEKEAKSELKDLQEELLALRAEIERQRKGGA